MCGAAASCCAAVTRTGRTGHPYPAPFAVRLRRGHGAPAGRR